MASYVELNLDQGATFVATLDLSNSDGTPINVSSNTFICQMRKSYYSSNAAADILVTALDAANGNVELSMNASTTSNIKPGRYLIDLKMISDTSGTVLRIVEGIMTVSPQVSR